MYPSEEMPRLTLRIPADLKLWLEKKAKREAASQNTLIVQALRLLQERSTAGRAA
ncbi:MAG: Arc-like binding domain [Verrucomicrobiota bacterium]|jgi:predicted HicB family RNase H-like nuclease